MPQEVHTPMVSVLMTSYNRERFIEEAVQSVLTSTYKNLELIISDDCSADATIEIVKKLMKSDPRIRLHINQKNLGDYPNRNMAASLAQGKYMMYVDSDDMIAPDAIEFAMKHFALHPQAAFSVIYPHTDITTPLVLDTANALRKHFFDKSFLNLGPGGVIFNREFFINHSSYSTKYGPANDLYSHLKFAAAGSVLLLPYRYLIYRIHDGQESTNKFVYLYLNHLFIRDALKEIDMPFTPKEKNNILKRYARNNVKNIIRFMIKTRRFKAGWEAFQKSKIGLSELF